MLFRSEKKGSRPSSYRLFTWLALPCFFLTVLNFTGPQGFGIANMADGLFAIRKLVYEEKKVSMEEFKEALAWNYDKGLGAQSAGDMTEMIMKAMQKAGKEADASTAAGLLKTFIGMKPGEQKTQRFKEIHDMIDEVPKFGNDIPEIEDRKSVV